jgi:hypothetical protein
MAFAMRDEWKQEPVSTTGASYVEPSATDPIKPAAGGPPVPARGDGRVRPAAGDRAGLVGLQARDRLLALAVEPGLSNR